MRHTTFILALLAAFIVAASSSRPPRHIASAWATGSLQNWALPSASTSNSNNSNRMGANNSIRPKLALGMQIRWGDDAKGRTNGEENNEKISENQKIVPFIIQKIGRGTQSEIKELTELSIDVFFNSQDDTYIASNNGGNGVVKKKRVPPWKSMQLAYLRNYQEGEMMARNLFKSDQLLDLIVARRVYAISSGSSNVKGNRERLIVDVDQIYNLEQIWEGTGEGKLYVSGEMIGYSEVSEKNFGLGGKFDSGNGGESASNGGDRKSEQRLRPYLSNLSVVEYARRSGVGSKLLDACEDAVREWNVGHTEMVLQVEEDNPKAISFYERRGWKFVFADPTCKRYNTSGLFLGEDRITKYAMVKQLENGPAVDGDGDDDCDPASFIRKLRNSFFVQ